MKNCIKTGNKVGIFLALLFVFCFGWYWVHPVHQELHQQLLEMSFCGFTGMNAISFFFGLVQSYIWGYIGVALWCLSSFCCSYCGFKD